MQMWVLKLAELLYRKGAFADELSGTCRDLMQQLLQAASKIPLMRAGCGWFVTPQWCFWRDCTML